MASGLFSSPFGRIISRLPPNVHPNNSPKATSKVNVVFQSQLSVVLVGNLRCYQHKRFTIDPCSTKTPLGLPVEPDV